MSKRANNNYGGRKKGLAWTPEQRQKHSEAWHKNHEAGKHLKTGG